MRKSYPTTLIIMLTFVLLLSCGEKPSAPPEMEFGALEVWAYYDSAWVDSGGNAQSTSILVPSAVVVLDDSALTDSGAVPLTITGIVPGQHYVHIRWNDYQNSLIIQINPGETVTVNSTLSQSAPDFSAPAIYYDTLNLQIVHLDTISLADYEGKVILLFYFGYS